jgi:lactobin A/cerein 7B family class IIb bacteriocin
MTSFQELNRAELEQVEGGCLVGFVAGVIVGLLYAAAEHAGGR